MGYYSFEQTNSTDHHLRNALIYNLGNRWMLLVPLAIKCAHQPVHLTFTECQYTMRQTKQSHRLSPTPEYMTTQLSVVNMSDLGSQSVLFLQPGLSVLSTEFLSSNTVVSSGEISLRSCKAYDCARELVYLTASNETFDFHIDYEKVIGAPCQTNDDCQYSFSVRNLLRCEQASQTCQCAHDGLSEIELAGVGRVCSDSIDRTNCTEFPRRCQGWCDGSETSHCLCPKSTRKVRKISGVFDCELEPTDPCQFDDEEGIGLSIRKCPTGTFCDGDRCRPATHSRLIVDEPLPAFTTPVGRNLSSAFTRVHRDHRSKAFIRTLMMIAVAILLLFILIILIIVILIKSQRWRSSSTSSEDKASSSSFAPSTSTVLSMDLSTAMNYHHHHQLQLPPRSISTISSHESTRQYDNYLTRAPFLHGLVPQSSLSSRFHQQQQQQQQPVRDDRRRMPLHIRSPSLARINPFLDHGSLATNEHLAQQRSSAPKVTRLHNGDVIISA